MEYRFLPKVLYIFASFLFSVAVLAATELSTSNDVTEQIRAGKQSFTNGRYEDALELLRHDCAHVMAEAVQELYPGTQVTIGPAIEDGFYYDHLSCPQSNSSKPLRVRSMVGLVPLFACLVLEDEFVQKLPGFKNRLDWFLRNRKDLATQVCTLI